MMFTCSVFDRKYLFGQIWSKNPNCQFELKFATYNQFHNILRLFDVLPNFPLTTSETMGDYYLYTWYKRAVL